ncbi:MAG: glucarate transporter [Isosphaeraceae bacterium]|jgi:sugar phosphate permease|nr:MAG: glucarate transporter [Isosphaeraceae bacterium]
MADPVRGMVEVAKNLSTAGVDRPTRVRYGVLGAACLLAVVTYIHRIGFASATTEFRATLGLSDGQVSWLMAAFMVAYGVFEVPWGNWADRLGVRRVLTRVILGGSGLTAALVLVGFLPRGAVWVFPLLLGLRFLFGMFQAGTFPAVSRMMADWMPVSERGGAQGLIWMSARVGGALAPLLVVGLIQVTGSWMVALAVVSSLGVAWCLLFRPWFRDRPEETAWVNASERALIASGRGERSVAHGDVSWWELVKSRQAVALCLMYGCLGYSGNFFSTLMPTYLKNHRGLDPDAIKLLTALPFACGVLACLGGGVLSDAIVRWSGRRWGRPLVGMLGMGLAGAAIVATLGVEDVGALGLLIGLTFVGNDLAMGPAWAAAADIGERQAGTLSGAMNMTASLTAALMAVVTGALFDAGQIVAPFVLFGLVYGLGAVCWLGVDVTKGLGQEA